MFKLINCSFKGNLFWFLSKWSSRLVYTWLIKRRNFGLLWMNELQLLCGQTTSSFVCRTAYMKIIDILCRFIKAKWFMTCFLILPLLVTNYMLNRPIIYLKVMNEAQNMQRHVWLMSTMPCRPLLVLGIPMFYSSAHRCTGIFGLGGGGGVGSDFLAQKIYTIPECVIVEIGIQTHSNCMNSKKKLIPNLPCDGEFFVGVKFWGFWIFQVSQEKIVNLISDCIRWNSFLRMSCTVFERYKNGSHIVVFVTLFATNFIEVQQC